MALTDLAVKGAKPKDKDYIWLMVRCRVFKRHTDGLPYQYITCGILLDNNSQTDKQFNELLKENARLTNELKISKVSKSEKKVLKLLAEGLSAKMISDKLNISEYTVCSHRKNLLAKLNLHNTAALVNFATECGLN